MGGGQGGGVGQGGDMATGGVMHTGSGAGGKGGSGSGTRWGASSGGSAGRIAAPGTGTSFGGVNNGQGGVSTAPGGGVGEQSRVARGYHNTGAHTQYQAWVGSPMPAGSGLSNDRLVGAGLVDGGMAGLLSNLLPPAVAKSPAPGTMHGVGGAHSLGGMRVKVGCVAAPLSAVLPACDQHGLCATGREAHGPRNLAASAREGTSSWSFPDGRQACQSNSIRS